MFVKTRKVNQDGMVRLETSGEVREVIINEDFLNPKAASVAICFRGKDSSGIVELSPEEIEMISRQIQPKMHLVRDVKVLKFKK